MSDNPVGFIGLGLLGSALAGRVHAAGFPIIGFDRDDIAASRCLGALGGQRLDSARAVARSCTTLVLALPNDAVSRMVLAAIADVLTAGQVVIDATTGDPQTSLALAARLERQQVDYLDATVSGSSAQVAGGDAVLLVGGRAEVVARCTPVLSAIAPQVLHTGPCGSGAKLKLVTNLVLGLNRAALAEGLALAGALGIDPAQALTVLSSSMAYSRIMDTKGDKMVHGDFTAQARLSQHLKDVRLMQEVAARTGQPLPLTNVHQHLLEFAEELGLGQLDNSAIIQAIQRWAAREHLT